MPCSVGPGFTESKWTGIGVGDSTSPKHGDSTCLGPAVTGTGTNGSLGPQSQKHVILLPGPSNRWFLDSPEPLRGYLKTPLGGVLLYTVYQHLQRALVAGITSALLVDLYLDLTSSTLGKWNMIRQKYRYDWGPIFRGTLRLQVDRSSRLEFASAQTELACGFSSASATSSAACRGEPGSAMK